MPTLSNCLHGQWLGRYSGTNSGTIVIDLDDFGTHYEGRACAFEDDSSAPSTFAVIKTADKARSHNLRLQLYPIDPRTNEPTTWNQLAPLFPSATFPQFADVTLKLSGEVLNVTCKTNIGTCGSAKLPKSKAGMPSECPPIPEVKCWKTFKEYLGKLNHRRYIYRGQERPFRLCTSFHRTGRADLPRSIAQDIQALHRHLSARTNHIFNLAAPDEKRCILQSCTASRISNTAPRLDIFAVCRSVFCISSHQELPGGVRWAGRESQDIHVRSRRMAVPIISALKSNGRSTAFFGVRIYRY